MRFNFSNEDENSDVHIFGCLIGKDSGKLLEELRKTSYEVEVFDVESEVNPFDNIKVFDAGDIKPTYGEEVKSFVMKILKKGKKPFMISKSHLSTYFSLLAFKEMYGEVKVVVFDAHGDIKDKVGMQKRRKK